MFLIKSLAVAAGVFLLAVLAYSQEIKEAPGIIFLIPIWLLWEHFVMGRPISRSDSEDEAGPRY